MAMTRCKANLHFYDTEKHDTCPYCESRDGSLRPVEIPMEDIDLGGDTCTAPTITMGSQKSKTVVDPARSARRPAVEESTVVATPAEEYGDEELVQTVLAIGPMTPGLREESVVTPSPYQQFVEQDGSVASSDAEVEQKTVMLFPEAKVSHPVVGWLVAVGGAERGRDYRIKSGMNEIARDEDPEVDIVIRGDSTISRRHHAEIQYDPEENVFYLIRLKNDAVKVNNVTIKRPTPLNPYDILQFGETRLVFVPLCSEKFQWTANP